VVGGGGGGGGGVVGGGGGGLGVGGGGGWGGGGGFGGEGGGYSFIYLHRRNCAPWAEKRKRKTKRPLPTSFVGRRGTALRA